MKLFLYSIALFLHLFLPYCLLAQQLEEEPLIEHLYGRSGQDRLVSMVENWEGTIAAVGQTNQSNGAAKGSNIYLLLLDEKLKRTSEVYIGRNGNDAARRIRQDLDGRYLIVGHSETPADRYKDKYFGKKDGWLLVLNESGQTEKELILGSKENDVFIEVLPLPNGDKIIVGNSGEQAWVLRINAQLKVLWQKKVQYHGLPTQALGATLGGAEQVFISGYAEEESSRKMWLAAFDGKGSQSWGKIFPAAEATEGANIIRIDEKSLGVTGYVNSRDHREEGFFCRIDLNGNVQAYKTIGGREDDRLSNLCLLYNGEIALIGQSQSFARGSRRPTVWAVRVDQDGFLQEEAYYGSKLSDEGCAILQRGDGSLVALGASNQQILKGAQGWVAQIGEKLDLKPNAVSWNYKAGQLYYPNGQYLSPNERSFLAVHIDAPPGKGLTHLRAKLSYVQNDSSVTRTIKLPSMAPGQNEDLHIPLALAISSDLQGEIPMEVQLFQGKQKMGTSTRIPLRLGRLSKPQLELSANTFPTQVERGTLLRNSFTLRNKGQGTARAVSLELHGSKGLQIPKAISIGDLAPGEYRTYELPFGVPANFTEDSVWIRGRVADLMLEHTQVVDWHLPLAAASANPPAKESLQKDYLTAVWLHPNPDHYEGRGIVWGENEIYVQVKAVSNKTLDKPNFCLEINGKPCVSGTKMDEVSIKGTAYSRTFTQRVKLSEGTTTIRTKMQNEAGKMETDPIQIIYSPSKPNLHLISIGVPAVDLKYTHRDARDFAQVMLQSNGQLNQQFQSVFVDTLIQEKTTAKTEILKTLRRLQYRFADRQIGPQDLILVFISSHGINTPQGVFHIAASDYDGPFLQETSLDFEKEIINYLASISCRKLFLIDACHSGAGSEEYASSQLSGERMNQLTSGQKGLSLMMSCRANEYSYEDDQWQNGAFTQAMLHTIEQFTRRVPGIDLNQDGALDIKELYTHLEKEVPKLVQNKRPKPQTSQQPLLVSDPLSSPVVLFQLPKNK